jgi:protein involved in polysaccharide export with SLBB domain
MKPGKVGSTWLSLLVLAAAGCAGDRGSIDKSLLAERQAEPNPEVRAQYVVGCPDVLELRLPQRPELSGTYAVNADGRIDLGDYGRLRVAGKPVREVARLLAAETGSLPQHVHVRVVEYHSGQLLLFGEVLGSQRSVPYQGQETVLELLQRVGGITPSAEPADVYVVRTHLGGGRRPEVYHVDLRAIVMEGDQQTNLRLLPFDQIYVGSTRQAELERLMPPWLRAALR